MEVILMEPREDPEDQELLSVLLDFFMVAEEEVAATAGAAGARVGKVVVGKVALIMPLELTQSINLVERRAARTEQAAAAAVNLAFMERT